VANPSQGCLSDRLDFGWQPQRQPNDSSNEEKMRLIDCLLRRSRSAVNDDVLCVVAMDSALTIDVAAVAAVIVVVAAAAVVVVVAAVDVAAAVAVVVAVVAVVAEIDAANDGALD
jgi:hypothetical protein